MESVSRTAIVVAQFRAAHTRWDPDPIFEDDFALAFAGCEEADVKEFFAARIPDSLAHVARLFPAQRARFVEQQVASAVMDGVAQYVVLGAGLDSFAWRRLELARQLGIFEVDHPATQSWKRARLEEIGLDCPPNLHFASVDFTTEEDLGDRLIASGFDPARPSIWSWLGVILYLPLDVVQSTLHAVEALAAPGSKIIASYGVVDDRMELASQQFAEFGRAFTARVGEPQITWVAPADIEAVARAAGWPRVTSVDPASFYPWFAERADGLEPVRYEWLLVADN